MGTGFFLVENRNLVADNTMRLEATAKNFAYVLNAEGISKIFSEYQDRKFVVLGKGSNVILSRSHYDDSYLFISTKLMNRLEVEGEEIIAECGVELSELAWFALENHSRGFEFLEDIPGTVGGAIIMNAGTYADKIGDLVSEITYFHRGLGKILVEKTCDQDFSTRSSKWHEEECVILSCRLSMKKGDHLESLTKQLEIKRDRYTKQPRDYPNAGSVFKRPVADDEELQVWRLTDDCGLRGYKVNGAMFSDKHTGFIVNTGDAEYEDLMDLVQAAKEKVKEKFSVDLELEWKII